MKSLNKKKAVISSIGILGTAACVIVFASAPSFPTPDKMLVFLTFIFMIFNQAWGMLKKFVPFVSILLAYDAFRGIADYLNDRVNFHFMPQFDEWMFGGTLPTVTLQQWLVHGGAAWYDFVLYGTYMLHFVLPFALAAVIYKLRETEYWRYALTFIVASFTAFIIYVIFPAAPPWMATLDGTIPHITRVSSEVYVALGITNFPSVYNNISPNEVAAVPSLHCAYALLVAMFVFKLFGRKWGIISSIYPALIFFGVVYMGEHYAFDVITGVMLAVAVYYAVPYMMKSLHPAVVWLNQKVALAGSRLRTLRPALATVPARSFKKK